MSVWWIVDGAWMDRLCGRNKESVSSRFVRGGNRRAKGYGSVLLLLFVCLCALFCVCVCVGIVCKYVYSTLYACVCLCV